MAIVKCKMCGGDLRLVPDATVCECEFCGTRQTVPSADSEKKLIQFERAERLRRNCEFDKAAGIYESIVAEFRQEAEAYWGLVLCKYGIEYVDDPATGKKIPTCHRSSFDSILDDSDYDQALENADVVARRVYRDEARQIEEIRRGILEVSSKEEPYDIFICYKETDPSGDRTLDSVLAQDIYDALTDKGYRTFFARITLEDKLGTAYEPYIFAALNSARIMLAVGTDYEYFNAVWVKNEWSRFLKLMASDKSKYLIPCYKGIDAYDMPREFAKLQAQDMGKVGAIQDLLRGIAKILPREVPQAAAVVAAPAQQISTQNYIRRAAIAMEDGKPEDARRFYDEALNLDPECAEAYLGLAMYQHRVLSLRELIRKNLQGDRNFQRAKQFASPELLQTLTQAEQDWQQELEAARKQEEERRKREEEKRRQTEEQRRQEQEHQRWLAQQRAAAEQERHKQLMAQLAQARARIAPAQNLISAGFSHTVALLSNGTVVATGDKRDGRCKVSDWQGIVAVSAGFEHTMGLRADGTVVTTGKNGTGLADVTKWKNVTAISAGSHSLALCSDGTAPSSPIQRYGFLGQNHLVAISGGRHCVGLCHDGTVLVHGNNVQGQGNTQDWRDIIAVAAGDYHTVGLRSDGTVVATEFIPGIEKYRGQCDVRDWTQIIAISAGMYHTVGLHMNGTVAYAGNDEYMRNELHTWTNIVAISAGINHVVGLRSDGTMVATGMNYDGRCNVSGWKLFDDLDSLMQRQQADRPRAIRRCQNVCQHCGGSFKGLLSKSCSACGKPKDY